MSKESGPVLVTGASTGIGRSIVELLSAHGRTVYATARRKRDLASLGNLPHVTALRLDVTREDEVLRSVATVRRFRRGLYGLVNNAGIVDIAPLVDTPVEELQRLLDVNLYGMHRMVRACFPLLAESHGRVVNIGSTNGFLPEAFAGAYCISKFAVEAYTDVLREEFSGLGVRVSVVEPGDFRSHIISSFVARRGAAVARALAGSPLRDAARRELAELIESPGALDRSQYPDPRPVAEAVTDALFSRRPKPRYLVGSRQEAEEVLGRLLELLVQLNPGKDPGGTVEELLRRLPESLR